MKKTAILPNELYFVTLTIVDWIDIFTRQDYFDLIIKNLDYCQAHKNLEVYEYVIMTNHLHLIALGKDKPLSDILRDFKTFTSKELLRQLNREINPVRKEWILKRFQYAGMSNSRNKQYQVWQNYNFPTLLSSNFLIDQKTDYIHENPVLAGFVNCPPDYFYSSANPASPLKTFDF